MKRDNAELQALFSKLFPFLDKEDIGAFFSLSQHKTFKNKEAIFKAGTTSRKAAFIVSGVTRAYFINKEGVEKNAMLRVEGTFMGVPEWLFDNSPTKYTCEAILECELLIFNLVDLENLAKKKPALFELYIWALK